MNLYFVAAAIIVFVIGLVHSILGDRFVFRGLRAGAFIPASGSHVLQESHVRILWASWHVVTVLGWFVAVLLLWLAQPAQSQFATSVVTKAVVGALLASSVLVLVATKGKHLGWAGLLAAAILVVVGGFF